MTPLMLSDVLQLAIALLGTAMEQIAAGKSGEPIELTQIGSMHAEAVAALQAYVDGQRKEA